MHGLTMTTADETHHDTHFHTIQQSPLFISLSTLTQHALALGYIVIVPTSLFGGCVHRLLKAF